MRTCAIAAAALLIASAFAADTTMITFDGASGTTHSFKAVSDPVMGGQSHSTFAVNNSLGVFSGEVKIVPSLKAPGFCNMQADKSTYPDISMHTHLMLQVRSVGPAYGAWKVAFGPADHSGSFFFSSYKADFAINGSAWQVVSIPFTSFSSKWSSYTGEPTTKCSDDKEVCPSAKRLAGITTFEIAAEGAAGKFELEVQKVWAGDGEETTAVEEEHAAVVSEADTADTTYYRIDGTTCADVSLGATVGICPTSLVVKLGKLAAGSCASQGYAKAGAPLSQKAGPCGTLNFNTYTKAAEATAAVVTQELAEPCCKACSVAGQVKYFSVDKTHNMCGEACMKPSQYKLYKIFEPGLTLATDNTPCADHKFHTYDSTVTHGFGPVKMTLDLYKPDATQTMDTTAMTTAEADQCPTITTQANFNLTNYVTAGTWYIHQQMAISYLPVANNYCVTARYEYTSKTKVHVHNYANKEKVNGAVYDSDTTLKYLGGICGVADDAADTARLSVGPCYLSPLRKVAFGPYWIVAAGPDPANYEWAVVSGGQPTHAGKTNGTCSTGTGVNGSGLWLFTRSQKRDAGVIAKMREVAQKEGFDLSVLNDVVQEGCTYTPAPQE